MSMSIGMSFLLIWVTSFDLEDDRAESIYVYISYVNSTVNLCSFLLLGYIADIANPKILTPLSFILRGCTLISIHFIKTPASAISYIVWGLETLTTNLCDVSLSTTF